MDSFISSVTSGTYNCRRADLELVGINVRYIYFYANVDASETFMPTDKLEEAFYRTLARFPWLAGYISQTSSGKMDVVVDANNLNVPFYRESQSDIHFSDISSAGFNPATWPSNLVPVGPLTCPDKDTGVIKLAIFHVVRLKDNSGVVISTNFNHGIADASSCLIFLNRWAEGTRALISGIPASETSFEFGSKALMKYLPTERAPLGKTALAVLSAKSRIADFIMWLSLNTRAKLLNQMMSRYQTVGHLFRISRAKLDELRSQALEHVPPGTRLSDNDLISAVIWKIHGRAEVEAAKSKRGWLAKIFLGAKRATGEHLLIIACDLRHRLGISELNYCGNPLVIEFIKAPMDHAYKPANSQTIATVAGEVRSRVSGLTPPYIGEVIDMIESDDIYTANLHAYSTQYQLYTTTTNLMHARMYEADFGGGVQTLSTVYPNYLVNSFIIFPSPPPNTDILVNICVLPPVMANILKSELWMDIAELVY